MSVREKSTLYPGATWDDCFEFAKKIAEFNLKSVSYQEVAKKYGITSLSTKSFTSKISATKQFGLITTSNSTIQLTQLGKDLIFPTKDITKLKIESFKMPPLYDKIINTYDGKAIPAQEIFENILMSEHRIAKNVKSHAARCFLESAEQLGLIKGGVLYYNDTLSDAFTEPTMQQESSDENTSDSRENNHIALESPLQSDDLSTQYLTQSIPVASGKVAKIIIPIDAEEDDLLLIKDMLDIIIKRRFKIEL